MTNAKHRTSARLEAGLEEIRNSPTDEGTLELIVCRPDVGQREELEAGELDLVEGLIGDNWKARGNPRTPDGRAHPEMQINIMNSRVAALVAGDRTRWCLAGDQLFVEMDLSENNLPPGSRLTIGSATIEITALPHRGCKKFVERFGLAAMKFVNSPLGRELSLRGRNAKVVEAGSVRRGDAVKKI